jgi:hypothetical protein
VPAVAITGQFGVSLNTRKMQIQAGPSKTLRFALLVIATIAGLQPCLAQGVNLNLSSSAGRPGDTVILNISVSATGPNLPSSVAWTLSYSSTDVVAAVITASPLATAAGKFVSCNPVVGGLSCVLWGLLSTPAPNGVIATAALTLSTSTANTSTAVQLGSNMAADSVASSLLVSDVGTTVAIQQNPGLNGFSCNPLSISPTVSSVCTVALTSGAPSGGATISTYASSGAAQLQTTVTIPQGSSSIMFPVSAGAVSSPTPVTLTALYLAVNETFTITVNPAAPALNSVSITPNSITSGQSATGTVTLTSASSSGGIVVTLSSSNSALPVPPSVTVSQGATVATFPLSAGAVANSTPVTVTASYAGVSKPTTATVVPATVTVNPAPVIGSAAFVTLDTTSQGNWKTKYGSEGYTVVGDSAINPSYVAPVVTGQYPYIWSPSTTEIRALQKAAGTSRIAGTWYSAGAFTIDLPFSDQATHQVAIYNMDWDYYARSQRVDVLDANNNLLDTRQISNFGGGQYLVWMLSGHVQIRVTNTNPTTNAVVGGIFFGGGSGVSGTSATFMATDTTTQGGWKSKYGTEGYAVVGDSAVNPSYVAPAVTGQNSYTWNPSTTDPRALQKAAGTSRIAGAWYSAGAFIVDLPFSDQAAHQVAVYCMDWDYYGRSQRIDVLDASNNVLDSRQVSSFAGGQYLVWALSGHVKIRVTNANASTNAVVEGIFFGGAAPAMSATFVSADTTTKGNWKSKYGAEGYTLAGDSTVVPSYVTPNVSGQSAYTWDPASTDVRALQKGVAAGRIASTWYSPAIFIIDLNFSDQATHQVAIYCLDYDNYGPRNQRIDILDANNNVLDTRQVSNFLGGQYLIWNMVGHVKIRATNLNTNAVIGGIFFH